ncbi:MAG: stage 0 sporulation family protein [Acidaminococcaceae bacterium]|nr:stage 0 sporulation family protein [Acidaminococcaceae bacterium]MDO4936037.1 stage 0 sporulation family protein [Phascolarctobacterium sp.]
MPIVVGVRFKKNCKIYNFDPLDTAVTKGEGVIVETIRGMEYGTVVIGPREISEDKLVSPLKPILRKATEADTLQVKENEVREKEAFHICERKIQNHGLPMNLVDVEFTFDVGKIIFYFTADGRVDFRELVKDLASVFRTRIELRQIGVRDEAKMLGGIGYCGRPICCATFLGDFAPVSIRMAKNQGLSLNPTKISGICGRLMCCLDYEDQNYTDTGDNQKDQIILPKIGSIVATSLGEGRVMGINRQDKTVQVQLAPNNVVNVAWNEVFEPEDLGNA